MIRKQWQKICNKVDAMTLRERVMVFAALAFVLVTLLNTFLLNPLLIKQKKMLDLMTQQQEKIKATQAQIEALVQEKNAQEQSPQLVALKRMKQELQEGEDFLQSNREKLVHPEKMADVLRQVLARNSGLQLLNLKTLPVTALFDAESNSSAASAADTLDKQVYKHGVELTVRGNYMDLLQYLAALERMPTQMFWGKIKMEVVQHPAAEMTLILYTLSLDKVWLQI